MTPLEVVLAAYRGVVSQLEDNAIPVRMRAKRIVGTVQDDPFDCWMETQLRSALPSSFEVVHSGPLTTPDLVIRDRKTRLVVGLEVKKLIQRSNGTDSRGLTIDYNSCLPCGSTFVKIGEETLVVPCYYFFALLSPDSKKIVSSIFMDGDFLNYDFNLHKESKYANYTEYQHGPYAEGSVRHRRMYTYPNPLNSRIKEFFLRHIVIAKKNDFEAIDASSCRFTEQIVRKDRQGNEFHYYLDDETGALRADVGALRVLTGVFDGCKVRKPKERVAAIPVLKAW